MESITCVEEIELVKDNKVLIEKRDDISFTNSKIVFKGKNNIFHAEEGVKIKDSVFIFEGDNSVVYLSKNFNTYLLNVTCYNNNAFYMGENNYMNGKLNVVLSEQKHVIIGNRGLFSFGIWIRLADPHLIYDCNTKRRKNPSKSVFLGDHVWVGQSAMVLKGTKAGSGSIIGAMSLVSGKRIASNSSWAGNPARKLSEGVFFTGDSVHKYKQAQTQESMTKDIDDFVYKDEPGKTKSFDEIDEKLSSFNDSEEMLKYLKDEIRGDKEKNRFFIGEAEKTKRGFLGRK